MIRPINLSAIVAFERIKIETVGRLNSTENRSDQLSGVRIKLSDRTYWLVLDGTRDTFETYVARAPGVEDPVLDCGHSDYVEKYGSQSEGA